MVKAMNDKQDSRELFQLEMCDACAPMNTDPFYKWLCEQPERVNHRSNAFDDYLRSLSFDKTQHKLNHEQIEHLRFVYEHYWYWWTASDETFGYMELFTGKPRKIGTWYSRRFKEDIKKQLLDLIESKFRGSTKGQQMFRFQVINGYLFFSQGISSRPVCKVDFE